MAHGKALWRVQYGLCHVPRAAQDKLDDFGSVRDIYRNICWVEQFQGLNHERLCTPSVLQIEDDLDKI